MTWHQHTTSLAIRLRNLITTPWDLTGADIVALSEARTAVWGLVHDVYGYITETAQRRHVAGRVNSDERAAIALVLELDKQRLNILSELAPASLDHLPVTTDSLSRVGSAWRAAGRDARLAHVVWDVSPIAQRPTGRALVPMLADMASLAWAISRGTTHASPHWLAATSSACPPAVLDHAAAAQTACASALPALQKSGGLQTYTDIFPAATTATTVETLAQLAGGIRASKELLDRQPHMSPAMVAFFTIQHKGTTELIANALSRVGETLGQSPLQVVGRRLVAHSQHLDVGIPRVTDVTTIAPITQAAWAAYRQAGLVFQGAETLIKDMPSTKDSAVALLQAATYIPEITTGLANLADRHISRGEWVVRTDRTPDSVNPWARTDVATQLDLSTQLSSARTDAETLRIELPRLDLLTVRRLIQPLVKTRPGLVIPDPTGWIPRR